MTNLDFLALADDLTGALEVGSKLAAHGIPTAVSSVPELAPEFLAGDRRALVIDTETRHLSGAEAARIISRLTFKAKELGIRHLFKKTDSTLRGNIASELGAFAQACPDSPVLYVPAYPQMGRTVKNGYLYVNGIPVSETAFAFDRLNPVRESHIPSLLGIEDSCAPVITITASQLHEVETAGIYVLDGEKDEEVREAAHIFAESHSLRLAAGPAAFVQFFAQYANLTRLNSAAWPAIKTCLVINGSLHERSLQQIAHAQEHGWQTCAADSISAQIAQGSWIILAPTAASTKLGLQRAERLGASIAGILQRVRVDALIVFGGDTAFGTLRALGHPLMEPLGEVVAGIPLAKIKTGELKKAIAGPQRDFSLITKAGGFGDPDILSLIRSRMADIG